MSNIPSDLKYTTSHEWVRLEGDTATVGITAHAQDLLGDIVYVELPELEKSFAAGDACAVVESVKAAADVYAPVQGEVVAVNDALAQQPELVNSDSYGAGWLYKVRVANPAEVDKLLSADGYQQSLNEETI
jgi:glycine cleavage system H protein